MKNKIFLSKTSFIVLIYCFFTFPSLGQEADQSDALFIKEIYNFSLTEANCYHWLDTLSMQIGHRLSGSDNNYKAIDYTKAIMEDLEMDKVILQECMVKNWKRGNIEKVKIKSDNKTIDLKTTTLGNTIGTSDKGIWGELIEVHSLDTLDKLGEAVLKDKIVFFNRPADPTKINSGQAYGGAVDQRVTGASRAAKYKAKGVLVRSVTTSIDDVPHTGVCYYTDSLMIPAMAISTKAANELSKMIAKDKVDAFMQNNSRILDDTLSYNVVGEIKGEQFPEEIILVGGHLDSWDVGGGAHDDGAGCVHAMQVIQTLKELGYKPKRTIRCVMFNNEENGLGGGTAYAKASNENGEFHLAALESDSGGFTPRGFTCTAEKAVFNDYFKALKSFEDLLANNDLYIKKGGGGADINPLKSQMGLLIGFKPDSQRYFDFHHTENDNIHAVNKRELELGAAAIASLVYLIDKYGLSNE